MWRMDLHGAVAGRRRGSDSTAPLSTQPQGTRRRRSPYCAPYPPGPLETPPLEFAWSVASRTEATPNIPPPPPPPSPSPRKRKPVSSSSRPSDREQDAACIEYPSAGTYGMRLWEIPHTVTSHHPSPIASSKHNAYIHQQENAMEYIQERTGRPEGAARSHHMRTSSVASTGKKRMIRKTHRGNSRRPRSWWPLYYAGLCTLVGDIMRGCSYTPRVL